MDSILAIVAARGGSKGLENKNVRELCGIPLIAHTIRQAKEWGEYSRLVCSTDSETIASIAAAFGAEVPFRRPANLATDTAGKIEVLRHALETSEQIYGTRFETVIDLDATAPIRRVQDIEGSFRLFKEKTAKSVFSVTPCRKNPYFNMVEESSGGNAVLSKSVGLFRRRQDAPRVFDMNASIYVYDRDYLLSESTTSPISDYSFFWIMDELSAFDIDTEADFLFVEFLVSKGLVEL